MGKAKREPVTGNINASGKKQAFKEGNMDNSGKINTQDVSRILKKSAENTKPKTKKNTNS